MWGERRRGRRTSGEEVLWEKVVGFETVRQILGEWYGHIVVIFFVEVVLGVEWTILPGLVRKWVSKLIHVFFLNSLNNYG